MAERSYLGELELMILLSVVGLGEEAYGVPISHEIEKHVGREVSLGSVYAALERLAARGLVASRMGESTPERGGKARRYFRVTKVGLRQMQETRRVLQQMWRSLPVLRGERP
jgi:DNA-binding PadR family transcriptional regulator